MQRILEFSSSKTALAIIVHRGIKIFTYYDPVDKVIAIPPKSPGILAVAIILHMYRRRLTAYACWDGSCCLVRHDFSKFVDS